MICKKCGKEIDNDSKFCTFCGESFEEETVNEQPLEEIIVVPAEEEQVEEVVENKKTLPEEDKSNFSAGIYTNEFEYTKKVFNEYYRAEFGQRGLAGYIVLQILLLNCFIVPGVVFAIIYWCITNPITKASQWRNFIFANKGRQPLYRFFFNENSLVIRRNRVEECTIPYKDFKKIVFTKKGIIFLSKVQDFFIPVDELKNKNEIIEVLQSAENVKLKGKLK